MHIVVATIVHAARYAHIHHRQIPALLAAGHRVTHVAPALDPDPPRHRGLEHLEVPRAIGRMRVGALGVTTGEVVPGGMGWGDPPMS